MEHIGRSPSHWNNLSLPPLLDITSNFRLDFTLDLRALQEPHARAARRRFDGGPDSVFSCDGFRSRTLPRGEDCGAGFVYVEVSDMGLPVQRGSSLLAEYIVLFIIHDFYIDTTGADAGYRPRAGR